MRKNVYQKNIEIWYSNQIFCQLVKLANAICWSHGIKCVKLFVQQIGTTNNPMLLINNGKVELQNQKIKWKDEYMPIKVTHAEAKMRL